MEEKLIYLYVKTSPLGLKYLGITTWNPHKYKGSGTIWKRHLKKNNISKDVVKTEILYYSYDRNEVKEKGLYYSALWNIVKSKEWANLMIENANTSFYLKSPSEDVRKKISEKLKGLIKSPETCKRLSKALKGKKPSQLCKDRHLEASSVPIVQLDLEGNFISEYKSISEAVKYTGYEQSSISSTLRKKTIRTKDFIFVYKKDYDENKKYNYINTSEKPILQFDKQGNFLKEWKGVNEFKKETGLIGTTINIQKCCRGERSIACGYKWKYKYKYDNRKRISEIG